MTIDGIDWTGFGWRDWADLDKVRARLAAGADPNILVGGHGRPLHAAARDGSPAVVAELAARVDDVDDVLDGRTALWAAVHARKPHNARTLVRAGADPWRPMMAGWSPGRLSLAGPTTDLFDVPAGVTLSPEEAAAVAESRRLTDILGDLDTEGLGLACIAGIDAAEAARRLAATPYEEDEPGSLIDHAWEADEDYIMIMGATTVDGGCVITQPWGYAPSMPAVLRALSAGTVCYALYANPKSGDQGSVYRDGAFVGGDLLFGFEPEADAPADEILASYLYPDDAVSYACARAGLRLNDADPVVGPPHTWLTLPPRDYWQMTEQMTD